MFRGNVLLPSLATALVLSGCGADLPADVQSTPTYPLTIRIPNIERDRGQVCYTLVNEASREAFPGPGKSTDGSRADCVPVTKTGVLDIRLENVPAGKYALSVFHDRDGDNELDTGLFGAPTEPLGLSTVSSIPLRKPRFDECAFSHSGASMQTIKLHKIL